MVGRFRPYLNIALESIDSFAQNKEDLFKLPDKTNDNKSHLIDTDNLKQPGTNNIDKLVDDLD